MGSKRIGQLPSVGTLTGSELVPIEQAGITSKTTVNKLVIGTMTATSGVVNVKDFGATGDGITDDSAAIQDAIAVGNTVYFPDGVYYIANTITLPAKNLTLNGNGTTSIIKGAVDPLMEYPTATLDGSGNVVTQDLCDLQFTGTAGNITLVKMHQTWDAGGKWGPRIERCYFYLPSGTSTTAKCISLSGVWTANIIGNAFQGNDRTNYGIFTVLTNSMSSSVMNLNICNNNFVAIGYPIWFADRTTPLGGRIEGVSIQNNSLVAGIDGIRLAQTNQTDITSNLISDFTGKSINSHGDFFISIVDNQMDGATACIHLRSTAVSLADIAVISGNFIGVTSVGIMLGDTGYGARGTTITGNTIGHAIGTSSGTGIQALDSGVAGINVTGNAFVSLTTAINYGSSTGFVVSGNSSSFVTTGPVNATETYSASTVISLTGGAAFEIINVPIPAGVFCAPPAAGFLMEDGSSADFLQGYFYSAATNPATTKTNAAFVVFSKGGGNITAGNHRFNVMLK